MYKAFDPGLDPNCAWPQKKRERFLQVCRRCSDVDERRGETVDGAL